ncbi:MAG: hypothetical protein WC553_03035 [Patescibacteria group bacterium]
MDLFDQILLLLVGVTVLLINLGLIPYYWLAYWPILLIAVALKEMLQNN